MRHTLPPHQHVVILFTWVDTVVLLKQAPPDPTLAVRATLKLGNAVRPGLVQFNVTLAGEVTVCV